MKKHKSEITKSIILLNLQQWPAVAFTLFVLCLSSTPPVVAQQDVHADLIAATDRKPAPAFSLVAETGKVTRISDYRNKVVLLNFWATDCGGCVMEIPSIIDIQASYKDKGFTVAGISVDIMYSNLKTSRDAWARVRPFMAKSKINYPILMGDESIFKSFSLTQLPDSFLIDKLGRIAGIYVGLISKDNVEANVGKLLSE